MQTLSFILCALGFVSLVSASLIKGDKMKPVLFLVFCANMLYATGYLVGGSGINGAASCYLGGVLSIINFFFESKNKPVPKWLIFVYMAAFIALNLIVGGFTILVGVAIIACLIFVLCIGQKDGASYRFWTVLNLAQWCLYDLLSRSYGALAGHVAQLLFTGAGMVIHDRKKSGKTQ